MTPASAVSGWSRKFSAGSSRRVAHSLRKRPRISSSSSGSGFHQRSGSSPNQNLRTSPRQSLTIAPPLDGEGLGWGGVSGKAVAAPPSPPPDPPPSRGRALRRRAADGQA